MSPATWLTCIVGVASISFFGYRLAKYGTYIGAVCGAPVSSRLGSLELQPHGAFRPRLRIYALASGSAKHLAVAILVSRSPTFFIKSLDRNIDWLDAVNATLLSFTSEQVRTLGELLARAVRREPPEGAAPGPDLALAAKLPDVSLDVSSDGGVAGSLVAAAGGLVLSALGKKFNAALHRGVVFDTPVEMTMGATETSNGEAILVQCLERRFGSAPEVGLQFDGRHINSESTMNLALFADDAKVLSDLLLRSVPRRPRPQGPRPRPAAHRT